MFVMLRNRSLEFYIVILLGLSPFIWYGWWMGVTPVIKQIFFSMGIFFGSFNCLPCLPPCTLRHHCWYRVCITSNQINLLGNVVLEKNSQFTLWTFLLDKWNNLLFHKYVVHNLVIVWACVLHPANISRRILCDCKHLGYFFQMVPSESLLCQVCRKTYRSRAALQSHMKIHFGKRKFTCPYCSRAFYSKDNLKGHIVSHTGTKEFKCELCGKEYRYRSDFLHHMRTKH